MSLARKLIRGSTVSLVDHAVKIAVMFVTTPLMVRHLGAENYGIWIVALTIVGYLRLLDFGVSITGSHFLAHAIGSCEPEQFKIRYTALSYLFNRIALASLLSTLLLSVVLPRWFSPGSVIFESRWILLGLGLATSFRFWTQISTVVLKSHLRYDAIGLTSIAKTLLQGFLILLVLINGHGVPSLILVFVATDTLDQMLLVLLSRRVFPDEKPRLIRKRPPGLGAIIRYSTTTTATILGRQLRNGIAPLVIGHFSGLAAVPVYSIGTRFTTLFADIINSVFGGNFLVAFSQLGGRNDHEALLRGFLTSLRFSTALATFGGCGIALFGPAFIERWIGPSFSDSGLILLILVGPTTLMLMQYPINNLLMSQNKQHWLAIASLSGGSLNVCVGIILAHQIGLFGVIWAAFIELIVVYAIVFPIFASRACKTPITSHFQHVIRHAFPFLLTAASFYYLAGEYINPNYYNLLFMGFIYTLVSIPIFCIFSLLPIERDLIARKMLIRKFR